MKRNEPSITIRRSFDAPLQTVFEAWTRPEHLTNWWRCCEGWSTPIAEVDLRVGGRYRLGMQDPEQAAPFVCTGEFREVDPPHKLVYTWSWETPGMEVGETLVTVQFQEEDHGRTEVVLVHRGFPDIPLADKHDQGWTGCLAELDRLLGTDRSS